MGGTDNPLPVSILNGAESGSKFDRPPSASFAIEPVTNRATLTGLPLTPCGVIHKISNERSVGTRSKVLSY
jgi:hypothetical protein